MNINTQNTHQGVPFRAQASYQRVDVKIDSSITQIVETQPTFQISDKALKVLDHVAASSKLTPHQKRGVINLLALADAYGGKQHDKIMRNIASLVALMEYNAKDREAQPTHSFKEALAQYIADRLAIEEEKGNTGGLTVRQTNLSIEMSLEQFSLQVTGLPFTEAAARGMRHNPVLRPADQVVDGMSAAVDTKSISV